MNQSERGTATVSAAQGTSLFCALLWGSVLMACQPGAGLLAIDLRTDLVPRIEFDGIRTELDAERAVDHLIGQADYLGGASIANFEAVPAGSHRLRVQLLSDSLVVRSRDYLLELADGDSGFTVLITRDCRNFACPEGLSCQNSVCGSAACIPGHEGRVSCDLEPVCLSDADCPSASGCSLPRCIDGACFLQDAGECAEGSYCDPELGCRTAPLPEARCVSSGPLVWSNIDSLEASGDGTGELVVGVSGFSHWLINTDNGAIVEYEERSPSAANRVIRPASTGLDPGTGIEFQRLSRGEPAAGYGLFVLGRLEVPENTTLIGVGSRGLLILSQSDLIIAGSLTVAANEWNSAPGPGGGRGGTGDGPGPGGGRSSGAGPEIHGGGASYGGLGSAAGAGTVGDSGAAGLVHGNDALIPLLGGSAGGGGADPRATGGHGGGALQLMARGRVEITASGVLDASGGRGERSGLPPGGGAGSGGAILLEAPIVEIRGVIGTNGGAGSGSGCLGSDGHALRAPATNGCGAGGGGSGSDSLGDAVPAEERATPGSSRGGGGGGAGRIRINTQVDLGQFGPGFLPSVESGLVTFGRLGECL